MDALHIEYIPTLRRPYLLLTFDGWSNAAGVATAAGHFLVQHLQAERFAWIDPEEFFSFTDQRPQARYNAAGEREVIWPANEFFASQQPTLDHDIIIAVGIEPHLKWRTFTNLVVELIKRCDVYQIYMLGALWADVLYSAPVHFSGSATEPQLAARLGLGSRTGSRRPSFRSRARPTTPTPSSPPATPGRRRTRSWPRACARPSCSPTPPAILTPSSSPRAWWRAVRPRLRSGSSATRSSARRPCR